MPSEVGMEILLANSAARVADLEQGLYNLLHSQIILRDKRIEYLEAELDKVRDELMDAKIDLSTARVRLSTLFAILGEKVNGHGELLRSLSEI